MSGQAGKLTTTDRRRTLRPNLEAFLSEKHDSSGASASACDEERNVVITVDADPGGKSMAVSGRDVFILPQGFRSRAMPETDQRHPETPAADLSDAADLLDAALSYAARGWPVHPLKPLMKKPMFDDWPSLASTDSAVIRYWWGQTPDANIGVVTGQRSGLLVLDVDGPEGRASLEGLEVPATLTQDTGRLGGGQHLIYAYEGLTRNRQGVRPGLDVRGDGGYIAAAPSIHPSGAVYRLHEARLAPAPDWLVEEAARTSETPGNLPTKATVAWPPHILALLRDPSDPENDAAVRHADRDTYRDRHKVLGKIACTMVRLGETDEGIFRRLRKSTLMARASGLHDPDDWLRKDIARARQKVESEPEGYQDLEEHVLLARDWVGSATTQKVLRAHQDLCEAPQVLCRSHVGCGSRLSAA